VNRDCNSAHGWSDDIYGTFVRRINAVHVNDNYRTNSVSLSCSKKVSTNWSLVQAYFDINLPSIDGALVVQRCRNYVWFTVFGDGFPNYEMSYIDNKGSVRAWLRVIHAGGGDNNGAQYLATYLGDWSQSFTVYSPPS